jgi:magnesium transporter
MKGVILNERNIGQPPGTPVYVGNRPVSATDISVLTFDHNSAEVKSIAAIDELFTYKHTGLMWINIIGLTDVESIKKLANVFNIHPLTVEDVLNTKQQPKVETFENYRFISFKSIQREKRFHHTQDKQNRLKRFKHKNKNVQPESVEEFLIEQISIIIMKNMLISFQEVAGDCFDGIRRRILENVGQIRSMGTDYLAYSLIDSVVDEYYLALDHLEDDIEGLEDRAIRTTDDTFTTEIQDTKKYLFQMKRAMVPLRDNLNNIYRQSATTNDKFKPFLQDLHENLNNAIETMENYREWLSNVMDVNISVLSYQLNKVMKIMALISSAFIPLTFIVGVYGMNFENMPELVQPWGYFVVLGIMAFIAVVMLIFFKIRRWF